MWNFLKADLQELVAVVKEDAASLGIPVVEGNADNDTANTGTNENLQHDEGTKFYNRDNDTPKSPSQMEAERRMNVPETFTVPLLPKKYNMSCSKNDTEREEEQLQENLDLEPIVNESATNIVKESTKDEAVIEDGERMDDGKVEDDDDDGVEMDEWEVQQIQEYLKKFNVNDEQIQQDITYLLDEYKATLRIQYETLVPDHVSHEEFWERYFYRCDVTRIEMEWDRYYEEEQAQRTREEGPRRGAKIVTSVTSFFGDAARAVATGMSNALTEDLQSYDNGDDDVDDAKVGNEISSTAGGLATSLFGHASTSHRPPFVMNTAVDEDDGDEEEEIGWDDDDEDEDEEEQIVFDDNVGGPVMSAKQKRSTIENDNQINQEGVDKESEIAMLCEQLKEQLKQAIEERDILHQTVSLQTKEIATLKSETVTDESKNSSADAATEIQNDRTDTNGCDDHVQGLQNQVQELGDMIRERDNQILEMKSRYEIDCKTLQERALELQNSNNKLLQQMQDMERTSSIERHDITETMQRFESEKVLLEEKLQAARSDVAASQTKIFNLQTELETTQEQLKMANENIAVMSQPIATTGIDENIAADTTTNMSSSGELTTATGVKVTVPPQPPSTVVSKISSNNDEEEEGWGDDWD